MYVRGCVEWAGCQTSTPGPAPSSCVVCQTEDVPPLPARTMFVATTSSRTRAGLVKRKWTNAASRKPSSFGLTVVSSRRSPANGRSPFVTWRSWSAGASASAARKTAVTESSRRLRFLYFPLMQSTIRTSILTPDEATPHLCRARCRAGLACGLCRAHARAKRRQPLHQGRPGRDHDPGPWRRDREFRPGESHDHRSDRRRWDGPDRHGRRVVDRQERNDDYVGRDEGALPQ